MAFFIYNFRLIILIWENSSRLLKQPNKKSTTFISSPDYELTPIRSWPIFFYLFIAALKEPSSNKFIDFLVDSKHICELCVLCELQWTLFCRVWRCLHPWPTANMCTRYNVCSTVRFIKPYRIPVYKCTGSR